MQLDDIEHTIGIISKLIVSLTTPNHNTYLQCQNFGFFLKKA